MKAVRGLLAGAVLLAATAAVGAMALDSLAKVDTAKLESAGWQVRKAASRLTLACGTCGDRFVATDVLLDRAVDATEERIRAGTTTAQTMLDVCRRNAETKGSECFGLKKSDLKGAVGFVSDVSLGPMGFSSTYVLWQDGKTLTIRNEAPSRAEAAKVGRLMFETIAPQVVE